MKKNIIKISLAALTVFVSLTSCDRNTDQFSSINEPVDQAMSRPESFRQALDGAYTSMKEVGYYRTDKGSQLIMGDLTTDNLVRCAAGRNSNFAASTFEFASDNTETTGLFNPAYLAISRANFVLANIDNGVLKGADRAKVEAEAVAIRAMIHFDLVRAYCKIPTQSPDAANSMGIYYAEKYNPLGNGGSRSLTVTQVYDKIIADLTFALNNIPVTPAQTSSRDAGRLTKSAVYGLLSRVYLYKGDYAKTIENGDLSLSGYSSRTSLVEFPNLWKSTSTDGVLFQILNGASEPTVTVGVAYNQFLGGQYRSEFVPDYNLFTSYSADDVRKESYFLTAPYNGKSYNHIIKYSGNGGPANVVPIKYLRTAEVVLNVAEAAYKTGDMTKALTLLNSLRQQRYKSYTPGTEAGTALLDAIYNQRRLELAFENDRWYTLKRLGLGVQRSGKGDLANGTGTVPSAQTLPASSTKWQWPLPINAIQANPAIQQNPGY